jgi:hypothetical protein
MDNPLNGYLYCYGQLDGPLWADMAGWWLGLTFEMSPLYIKGPWYILGLSKKIDPL